MTENSMNRNLAIAAALLLCASPALAQQTPSTLSQVPVVNSPPEASPEVKAARKAVRQACMEDVRTLCADQQPGGGRLMMCLKSHKDQVSAGCKTAFEHLRDVRKGA
jgi:hypothetical protein